MGLWDWFKRSQRAHHPTRYYFVVKGASTFAGGKRRGVGKILYSTTSEADARSFRDARDDRDFLTIKKVG